MPGQGLNKYNGKGRTNTCIPPNSGTKQLVIGTTTFVGKAARDAEYLKAAQAQWDSRTNGSGKTTVGHQKPGSLKCR